MGRPVRVAACFGGVGFSSRSRGGVSVVVQLHNSFWRASHSTSTRRLHSPVPGPCGPAAVITPACVVTVPLGSSNRDRLTSGSPVEEAEVVAVAGLVAAAATAAAGSSGPTSHTRVTTTGADELAWAARSCRGLVRAGGEGKGTSDQSQC